MLNEELREALNTLGTSDNEVDNQLGWYIYKALNPDNPFYSAPAAAAHMLVLKNSFDNHSIQYKAVMLMSAELESRKQ
jgi:hypothetical protein